MKEEKNDIILDGEDIQEDEINIMELLLRLWSKRIFIIKVTCFFIFIGLCVALFSSKVYTASCLFVPQTTQKTTGGGLSSLAAMGGINLGEMMSDGETLAPLVYPSILENIDYQKELMYSKIQFEDWEEPVSLIDYYTNPKYSKFSFATIKKYTIGLPFLILDAIRGEQQPLKPSSDGSVARVTGFSKRQYKCSKILKKKVTMTIDEKKGNMTITAEMGEPLAAAQLAQTAFELLQKYITEFKIQKAQANYEFIKGRYEEVKVTFEEKQRDYAAFQDANMVLSTAMAKTQEEQLRSEYQIQSAIYTELARQLEQANIKVKEDTPILTAVRPVQIPDKKSKPLRARLMVIYTFLGFILGCGLVFAYDFLYRQEALKAPLTKTVAWTYRREDDIIRFFKRIFTRK